MERDEFALMCEGLFKVENDPNYVISLFTNEVSKMPLLIEHKIDFLDALFNKDNQSKQQNFDELSEVIKYYYANHQATPKDTKKLIKEANESHQTAKRVQQEVKQLIRYEKRAKFFRNIRKNELRRSPRLMAKHASTEEQW